jgi:hypothetical protein
VTQIITPHLVLGDNKPRCFLTPPSSHNKILIVAQYLMVASSAKITVVEPTHTPEPVSTKENWYNISKKKLVNTEEYSLRFFSFFCIFFYDGHVDLCLGYSLL